MDPSNLSAVWRALLALLAEHGPGLHGLLSLGRLVAIEDGRAVIRYGSQHDSLVKLFDKNGKKDQVRDAITKVLNQSVGVKFEVDTGVRRPAGRRPHAGVPPAPPAPRGPTAARPRFAAGPRRRRLRQDRRPYASRPNWFRPSARASRSIRALMDELGAQMIKVE